MGSGEIGDPDRVVIEVEAAGLDKGDGSDWTTVCEIGSIRWNFRFSSRIQNDPSLKKAMFRGNVSGVVALRSPVWSS